MLYVLAVIIVAAVITLGLYQNRFYRVAIWKLVFSLSAMMLAGLFGISLWYYIEYGIWGGKSFFGCVFVAPVAVLIFSKILRVSTDVLMDMAGPSCAAFLALIKINCLCYGCCEGIILKMMKDGTEFRFPSQIIEGINGVVICVVLLMMQRDPEKRGKLAPTFLLLFGTTRFVLNTFRDHLWSLALFDNMGLFVPRGHLWAAVCIIWGFIWMHRIVSKCKGSKATIREVFAAILDMFRFGKKEKLSNHG